MSCIHRDPPLKVLDNPPATSACGLPPLPPASRPACRTHRRYSCCWPHRQHNPLRCCVCHPVARSASASGCLRGTSSRCTAAPSTTSTRSCWATCLPLWEATGWVQPLWAAGWRRAGTEHRAAHQQQARDLSVPCPRFPVLTRAALGPSRPPYTAADLAASCSRCRCT